MTREDFAYEVAGEGWYHVLVELDPKELEDEVLAEMLQEAQMAFAALLQVAPSVEDYDEYAISSEDLQEVDAEYLLDDDDPEILDLVDLMDKTLGEY